MMRPIREHASAWLVAAALLGAVAALNPFGSGDAAPAATSALGGGLARLPGQQPFQGVQGHHGLPASRLYQERQEARELATEPLPAWARDAGEHEVAAYRGDPGRITLAPDATLLCVLDGSGSSAC